MDDIYYEILNKRIALDNTPDMRKFKYVLTLTIPKWNELMECEKARREIYSVDGEIYFQDMKVEKIFKDELKVVEHGKDGEINVKYIQYLKVKKIPK